MSHFRFVPDGPRDESSKIREAIGSLFQDAASAAGVDNPMGAGQVTLWLNFIFPAIESAYWGVPVYTALVQRERILAERERISDEREQRWFNNTQEFLRGIGQDPEPLMRTMYQPAPAAEGGA